ncbi:MAG: hypothetical protein KF764_19920 [Labilithrix sp.]|nr:hypothetical protein [Labilithrix sp.]MBX3222818.1 hypothetical protein [Labilithrix sp.]
MQHGWQSPPPAAPQWGYPAPGGHGPMQGSTVARVPLMPGERVIYFRKPDQGMARLGYILAGVVLLPVLLGIYLLYLGIFYEEKTNHYYVVTTLRIFTVNARGTILEQIGIPEITDLVHRMGAGKNALVLHSPRAFIMFRREEQHDIPRLKPLLASLRDPHFLQQAPSVQFEP